MTWLIAHMWFVVGGAALLALLLGWSLRGAMLVSKLRRAEVERELTRVELRDAREEIEKLFAAQRKMEEAGLAHSPVDPVLQVRHEQALAELQRTREELERLKSAPAPIAAAAPVAAAAAPAMIAEEAHRALTARAETLEAKVAGLEGELAEARAAAEAQPAAAPVETGIPAEVHQALADRNAALEQRIAELDAALAAQPPEPEPAPAPEPIAAPEPEPDPKLVWQTGYLRQRVKALEDELLRQPTVLPVAAPEMVAETVEEASDEEQDSAEEELARLRWRNRYLEGRLAYFEGDMESVADEVAGEELPPEDDGEVDDVYEPDEDYAPDEAGVSDEDDEADVSHPADAILGQLEEDDARAEAEVAEPVKPLALEKPVDGSPDDLTLIGGIGPKIQEVLNGLGIFHYDQIADWTPENVAWVDEYLNFGGRISREGWVEQAAVLVGEGAEA
ncbi:MAG: hypothetical protein ACK46Q_06305 [Hyphomonas sp.]